MATDIGAGCSITWVGAGAGHLVNIETIEWSGMTRGYVETTHMGTGAAKGDTFLPYDTYDPGTLTVTYQYDEARNPPITGAAGNCTLTFPGSETYQCSAFLTNWSLSTGHKEKTMCTAELKFSGDITF